ncbi:MAG: HD domain-containing protein [Candidatus Omnitrophica bacterium]|nr:HD domain-containing protein [Candidatus Omnitrophota bacterium]
MKKNNSKYCKPMKNTMLWGLFFEKLLEHMNASVMVTDSSGTVIFANKLCLEMLGYHSKDVLGNNWITKIIPREKRAHAKKIFSSLKKEKTLCRFDSPIMGHEGVKKYLNWVVVPLKQKRKYLYLFMGKGGKYEPRGEVEVHELNREEILTEYDRIIEALFSASRISEPGTAQHAYRVMGIAVLLARKIGLGREKIEALKTAALLHDLGKLAVDETILFKNGKLTKQEFEEMKMHPHWGEEVIKLVCFLKEIVPIMAGHHENWDGSGYPRGIEGKDIPLEARILCIADIYEALTADRPYRKGFTVDEAVIIIRSEVGRKLDPRLTDIFLDMVEKGELAEEGF